MRSDGGSSSLLFPTPKPTIEARPRAGEYDGSPMPGPAAGAASKNDHVSISGPPDATRGSDAQRNQSTARLAGRIGRKLATPSIRSSAASAHWATGGEGRAVGCSIAAVKRSRCCVRAKNGLSARVGGKLYEALSYEYVIGIPQFFRRARRQSTAVDTEYVRQIFALPSVNFNQIATRD